MTEIQEGSKVARAEQAQLRVTMTRLCDNPHVSDEDFAAVCDAHLAVQKALTAALRELIDVQEQELEDRATELLEAEHALSDIAAIADDHPGWPAMQHVYEIAVAALSSEDATRPTPTHDRHASTDEYARAPVKGEQP